MKREYWRYLPIIWPYARKHRASLVVAVVLMAMAAVVTLAQPWPLAFLIDGVLGKKHIPRFVTSFAGHSTAGLILFAVLAGVVVSLVAGVTSLLSEAVNTRLERRLALDHRSDLYAHCQTLTQAFYDNRRTGDFMYRINFEAQALGEIAVALLPLTQSALTLLGMFAITATLDLKLALMALAITPLVYYATGLYGKYIVPRLVGVRNLEGESLGIVNETMGILRLTVGFNRQRKEYLRFRHQGERATVARVHVTVAQMVFSLIITICTAGGTALVLFVGAHDVVARRLSVGELVVLVAYIGSIYSPLQNISSTMAHFQERFIALQKSRELMSSQPEFTDAPDATDMARVSGRVTFENVSFNYKSRTSTLRDISFDVPAGTKVAIVGPTGAGKTTLVGLIPRFYDVTAGRITVDGIDIRTVTQSSLRENISIVPQEPVLFAGTIADNIRYGKLDATDGEVEAAAQAANAHDFITALPGGYDSIVGERGVNLSGGERQRICIARAFIKDAAVVILDEPTSSIDSRTEAGILEALERLSERRTTLLVAHRLSTVRGADYVLVLNDGELVEQGAPEELLATAGLFRQLHDLQTGHYPAAPRADDRSRPAPVRPSIVTRPKVVVLGMMSKMPVAGVVWQTVHYLTGLERLGCDAYYVEAHARTPSMFMRTDHDDGAARAATFIGQTMRRFGLSDRWAFHALHDDGACYGMDLEALYALYRDAELIINLHGGTKPLDEHGASGRLILVETDPVQLQAELHERRQAALEFLEPHVGLFTFGENLGRPECLVPAPEGFEFLPTRQPVVLDFWPPGGGPGQLFTTVGNWRQSWRDIELDGEYYHWSKHREYEKVLELPARTTQGFELALGSFDDDDRRRLEGHGWHIRSAEEVSQNIDTYRTYIRASRAEFTVAKDQNVRLRTGWFSDRSATYLAAGRPVVTQDTGFGLTLPTGRGLFAFSTLEEARDAVEAINADLLDHRAGAHDVAREFFDHEVVLSPILDRHGVTRPQPRTGGQSSEPVGAGAAPADDLIITPVRRRPTRLVDATVRALLDRAIPVPDCPDRTTAPIASSIVVVTHDNLPFLRLCLETVLANTDGDAWEVIVVDNGSSDGTCDYVAELARRIPRFRLIANTHNVGFPAAVNLGLAVATGDTLVVLNDDVALPPGWLRRLRRHIEDPTVGVVGPVTNSAPNEARVTVSYDTYGAFVAEANRRAQAHEGERHDIPVATMFCVAMPRATFERVGPLDEGYGIGLFEDDDFAHRTREAGLRVVCAEDVLVHHFGEVSFGHLVPTGEFAVLFESNRRRFEEKFGISWQVHRRRPDPDYDNLLNGLHRLMLSTIPEGEQVAVVSRGDAAMLSVEARRARHFPGDGNGGWAGSHPGDSGEAIRLLEAERALGTQWLVIPTTSSWWLEHYDGFAHYLGEHYRTEATDEAGQVVSLRRALPAALTQPACILGMHRSGTSLVARALNVLGIDLGPPETMLEANRLNPLGFWEHRDILAVNDELLAALRGTWDHPPLMPPDWHNASNLDGLRDRAVAILTRDFVGAPRWGWKDPRSCLTWPFWRSLVPDARVVLCIRHPVAVARSLEHAMGFKAALRLWHRYTAAALDNTAGSERELIMTERIVDDPRGGVDLLARFLGASTDAPARRAAMAVIEPMQWHHRADADDGHVPEGRSEAIALYHLLRDGGLPDDNETGRLSGTRGERIELAGHARG